VSSTSSSITHTDHKVKRRGGNFKAQRANARACDERLRLLSLLMASPDEILEDDWLALQVLGPTRRRRADWQEKLRRTADDLRDELGTQRHRLQRVRCVGYRWRSRWALRIESETL
jgi:DNA-binding response OmpR family regulator